MNNPKVKKIFIVDDDPVWTELLSQLLTDLGYTNIMRFSSGEECINYLHIAPSIVFLDYEMQKMNGIEVLKQVRQYVPHTAVVFCTAHENIELAVDAMKAGSFDYLRKSRCSLDEVAAIINEVGDSGILEGRIY